MWADDARCSSGCARRAASTACRWWPPATCCMHVRSRKPLQDTLTAIRLSKPLADCGFALARNAEQHLRSRLRLAQLYPRRVAGRDACAIAARCHFSLDELRYEYPDELVPPGRHADRLPARAHLRPARTSATRTACRRACGSRSSTSWR